MAFTDKKNLIRWAIIITSLLLLGLFLWNIIQFFDQLKREERKKMEIYVEALTEIIREDNSENFNTFSLSIIEKNTTTPMIMYSVRGDLYQSKNISDEEVLSQEQLKSLAETFSKQYKPIQIESEGELYQIVYYGNSSFINKTKYFPLVIISVIFIFLGILYFFYTISKSNEQNKLWAGMAKETAHQIGTPLSSLVGWLEILKTENVNPEYIKEIEKDILHFQTITDRFSNIGSVPTLEKMDLVKAATRSFEYIENRSSELIKFSVISPAHPIYVHLNKQLLSWTIENLVKNAIDAVKGKGNITMEISEDSKWVYLLISDTGKGISKRDFKRIFIPGETSKKRGWGLGLSLAKRIIEEYHGGKIKVLRSEIGSGTTFEIKLRKIPS